MECAICKCWVEIEEPNPTDVPGFICDGCLEETAERAEAAAKKVRENARVDPEQLRKPMTI